MIRAGPRPEAKREKEIIISIFAGTSDRTHPAGEAKTEGKR